MHAHLALASSGLDNVAYILGTVFVLVLGTVLMLGALVVRAGHTPRPSAGLAILAAYLWVGILTAIVALVPSIGRSDGAMLGTLVVGAIVFMFALDRYWKRPRGRTDG